MAVLTLLYSPRCPACIRAHRSLEGFRHEGVRVERLDVGTREGRDRFLRHRASRVPTYIISGPGVSGYIGLSGLQSGKTLRRYLSMALNG